MDKNELKEMGMTVFNTIKALPIKEKATDIFNAVKELPIEEKSTDVLNAVKALPPAIKLVAALTVFGVAWHQNVYRNVVDLPGVQTTVDVNENGNVLGYQEKDMRTHYETLLTTYNNEAQEVIQKRGVSKNDGTRTFTEEAISFEDMTEGDWSDYEALKARAVTSSVHPALKGRMME